MLLPKFVYFFVEPMKIHLYYSCPSVRMEQLDFHWTDYDEI
jgi:hypothetical protein